WAWACSVPAQLGGGPLGTGVIHDVLVVGRGGDEGGGGGVVELAGQAVGQPVQAGDGVVGEQRLVSPGQAEVVAQVGGGLGQVHGLDREPGGDALVQGGEDPHAELAGQSRLAEEDPGEGRRRVHVLVGEQPQFLQLGRGEQVCLVNHEDDPAVALGLLGRQQVRGLGHHL